MVIHLPASPHLVEDSRSRSLHRDPRSPAVSGLRGVPPRYPVVARRPLGNLDPPDRLRLPALPHSRLSRFSGPPAPGAPTLHSLPYPQPSRYPNPPGQPGTKPGPPAPVATGIQEADDAEHGFWLPWAPPLLGASAPDHHRVGGSRDSGQEYHDACIGPKAISYQTGL